MIHITVQDEEQKKKQTTIKQTMAYYPQLVIDALRTVIHPEKEKDIVSLDMVEDDIRIDGNRVSFSLILIVPMILWWLYSRNFQWKLSRSI
jgi:metal-sulfur cluster biosynthetic enzyme